MLYVYANCVDRDEPITNERIEAALRGRRGRLGMADADEAEAEPAADTRHEDSDDHGVVAKSQVEGSHSGLVRRS